MIGSFLTAIFKKNNLSLNSSRFKQFSSISSRFIEQGISSLRINSTNLTCSRSSDLLHPLHQCVYFNFTPRRLNWGYKGRMMLKDIKRRELLKKYAPVRIRLQTLRSNSVLPKIIKVFFIYIVFNFEQTTLNSRAKY